MKAGQRFEHRRYVVGNGAAQRPDTCVITRVNAHTVYYRTELGMRVRTDCEGFEARCVLRWVE